VEKIFTDTDLVDPKHMARKFVAMLDENEATARHAYSKLMELDRLRLVITLGIVENSPSSIAAWQTYDVDQAMNRILNWRQFALMSAAKRIKELGKPSILLGNIIFTDIMIMNEEARSNELTQYECFIEAIDKPDMVLAVFKYCRLSLDLQLTIASHLEHPDAGKEWFSKVSVFDRAHLLQHYVIDRWYPTLKAERELEMFFNAAEAGQSWSMREEGSTKKELALKFIDEQIAQYETKAWEVEQEEKYIKQLCDALKKLREQLRK
jgi:hypothetical protein